MFGTLNPKIPATRASDSTLKWSPKGLALNSTIVTSVNGADSFLSFSPSTGSAYAYFNYSSLAPYYVPYSGATADVNIGTWGFISSSSGLTSSASDYPYTTAFTTTYPDLVPYSVACYTSGLEWFYDNSGDGFLYDSMSNPRATVDYITGYIDTNSYNMDQIDQVDYQYYLVGFTTSINQGGSNFDNGITVSKDSASYAGYFSDSNTSKSATLCDGNFAGLFYDSNAGHAVYFCDGTQTMRVAGNALFQGEITVANSGTINRIAGLIDSISVTNGYTTTYTRNASGFVIGKTDGVRTWTYDRDANNNVTSWSVA